MTDTRDSGDEVPTSRQLLRCPRRPENSRVVEGVPPTPPPPPHHYQDNLNQIVNLIGGLTTRVGRTLDLSLHLDQTLLEFGLGGFVSLLRLSRRGPRNNIYSWSYR